MNNKSDGQTLEDLKKFSERYTVVQGHFQRVCDAAIQLAENKKATLKGLTANIDQEALLIEFVGRKIRINVRFDRKTESGVLHATDESAATALHAPEIFERIPFNGLGETALTINQNGDKLSLSIPGDCMALVARLIDTAIDRDPWK